MRTAARNGDDMKRLKRILSMILALFLVLCLASCYWDKVPENDEQAFSQNTQDSGNSDSSTDPVSTQEDPDGEATSSKDGKTIGELHADGTDPQSSETDFSPDKDDEDAASDESFELPFIPVP